MMLCMSIQCQYTCQIPLSIEKISFEWFNRLDSNTVSAYQYLLHGHQVLKYIIARYGRTELI